MIKSGMNDFELTPEEKQWFHQQGVKHEFSQTLKIQLMAHHKQLISERKATQRNWGLSWLRFGHWQPSRAGIITIAVLLGLLVVSGGVYAVTKWSGYLPGFGIIDQENPVRVLSSAQSQTKEGIELKVTSAFSGAEMTSVVFSLKGIPPNLYAGDAPLTPNNLRCDNGFWLELPNGQKMTPLGAVSLGYGTENIYKIVVFFNPLPDDVDRVNFRMDCIEQTYPGDAPEDWVVPLTFEPGTDGQELYQILKIDDPSASDTVNAIKVSELIPLEDKFIVIGQYQPAYEGVLFIQFYDVSFTDVDGKHLPYNIAGDIQFFTYKTTGRFAYIVNGGSQNFPITMEVGKIQYYCPEDVTYRLNLADFPPDNQTYALGDSLNVGNCPIELTSVKNDGTKLTLEFKAKDHSFYQVNLQDLEYPTRSFTARYLDDKAILSMSTATFKERTTIELRIGGIGLEPDGPWQAVIEVDLDH